MSMHIIRIIVSSDFTSHLTNYQRRIFREGGAESRNVAETCPSDGSVRGRIRPTGCKIVLLHDLER